MTTNPIEQPCLPCPWRVDSAVTWRRHAVDAVRRGEIVDCLLVGVICAGWLATEGRRHPAVLAAVFDGDHIPPDTKGWPVLFPDVEALEASLES